ncbi:Protein PYR1-3 [Galdieria sulphuraria]|nr:Protein PYR1-3 [Galdieria sulphuraria]
MQFIAQHGNYIGQVEQHKFYCFPTLNQMRSVTEQDLRSHRFGYRAKYLVHTIDRLVQLGGIEWLSELKQLDREQVVSQLMQLPGIGHKVASCIALVSLGKHDEIPVDTHIWQVVLKYYLPQLHGKTLTQRVHREIGEWFRQKFGAYAGWAHNTLFVGELETSRRNNQKEAS